ncbi:MAG: oligosaccharide repeat unit polymerase [bacterium]|nr:oligosaccharide repeat unit polymerase [bacterium]
MIWLADLALIALVLVADRRLTGRSYTPLGLFTVCWLGPLALRHLGLVDYELMRPSIALAVYGGFLCFCVGYAIVITAVAPRLRPLDDRALTSRLRPGALTAACVIATAGGLAATVVQTMSVISQFGLIGFLVNPLEVREEFSLSGWGALYLFNTLVPGLLVLRHRAQNGRVDKLAVVLGLAAVVSLVLANQKQALVKAVVMAAAVATLWDGRVRFRSVALAALTVLLFFVAYARVTSPYYHGDHRFYVRDGHIRLPAVLAPLGNPYQYLAAGFANLQVLADDLEYRTDGKQTLRPLRYLWIRAQGSHEIESHHGRYYYAPLFGNTHTYLRPYVSDGGVSVALLASALIGMGVAWLYLEIICKGRIWLAPAYGVAGWCLFISFFSNHWTYFASLLLFAIAACFGMLTAARPAREAAHGA